MSTKEEIKKLIFDNIGNPYDKGCSKNCGEFWTRHKKYEKSYTVKDLRTKAIIVNNDNKNNYNVIKSSNTPLIMPYEYSKKEIDLMNKTKNKNLINENNNLEEITEINNINNNENNNMIDKQNENQEIEIKADKEKEQIISEKSPKNENNINQKLINEEPIKNEILSFDKISDENDNYQKKVCNTSVKKNSNLKKLDDAEMDDIENKLKQKNLYLEKEGEQGYQIARKRLEELSSEITINEEMKSSMSIPNENSLHSSLSQAE